MVCEWCVEDKQTLVAENVLNSIIIHQIFSLACDWPKRHMTKYSPAKTGEHPKIFPNFQSYMCCKKDLKDDKHNSLHLGRKYARIFVLGHYLFLEAHSFPRATLSENCSLLRTGNVHGQISVHIFAPSGSYCLYRFIDSCHTYKMESIS